MCPLVSGPFNSLFSYGNSPFYEHHRRDLRVINQEPATGRILTVNDVADAVRGGSVFACGGGGFAEHDGRHGRVSCVRTTACSRLLSRRLTNCIGGCFSSASPQKAITRLTRQCDTDEAARGPHGGGHAMKIPLAIASLLLATVLTACGGSGHSDSHNTGNQNSQNTGVQNSPNTGKSQDSYSMGRYGLLSPTGLPAAFTDTHRR
jgi:hypothetical protein